MIKGKHHEAERRWRELLPQERLGVDRPLISPSYRTDFQKDYDRLIFSAAFRRLQDKTQVFPLAQTDYVRTRLTHSLEVSSVCRSLGTMLGERLVSQYDLGGLTSADIGAILAAAALAHDIGNPPFGHAGEDAISRFFKRNPVGETVLAKMEPKQQADLLAFEGNAQAFRVLTKLQNPNNRGGLQLSLPVIASIIKYPCASYAKPKESNVAYKKFNYFQAESELFHAFAKRAGLEAHPECQGAWFRHPFAYLLEAADDICYHLVDLEDAYRLSLLSGKKVMGFFRDIITSNNRFPDKRMATITREKDQVEYLRAFSIGVLIDEVIEVFFKREEAILAGHYSGALLEEIPSANALKAIREFSRANIYLSDEVLKVGIAGFKVIETLLEEFVEAVEHAAEGRGGAKTEMLLSFLPDQFFEADRSLNPDPYERILRVTDFVSGMTDRYAVKVFKMMTGVDLPS